jgi:transcriptional regulator with XRE-family HTH domain
MEPPKSQIRVLKEVLRESLRVRGLGPREIARQLDVSERTVMRWFASSTVDTAVLERLCALLGLSFFDLCELAARRVETRLTKLSAAQEQALVDDALLNYIFVNTLKGWTSAELKQEIDVPEPMFVDALIRLERLGLIGLLPGNEIRLRTTRDIQWRKGGPYSRFINMLLGWSLNKPDISDPRSVWALETIKLSSSSLAQLRRKFDAVLAEAMLLSEQDRRSNDTSRDWHAVVLTARRISFTPLSEWPTQYRGPGDTARRGSN